MMKKKIFVCCGTGIATSTVVVKKVEELLKTEGINFNLVQGRVSEAPAHVRSNKPDIIISTSDISGDVGNTPVVSGRPFLTGIKIDEAKQEIIDTLKK